jgi:hypothetical protein
MVSFEKVFKEAQSEDFAKLMATLPENPPDVSKNEVVDVVEKAKQGMMQTSISSFFKSFKSRRKIQSIT